jgi:hypothetical protein
MSAEMLNPMQGVGNAQTSTTAPRYFGAREFASAVDSAEPHLMPCVEGAVDVLLSAMMVVWLLL